MKDIQVTFDTHSPYEQNTQVLVEVCDEAMQRVGKPRMLNLAEGGTIEVDNAGRYYVTATLPTGESIGANVDVEEMGANPAQAVLESAEPSPRESLAWAFTRQRLPRPRRRELPRERGSIESLALPRFGARTDVAEVVRSLPPPLEVDLLRMAERRERWTLERATDQRSWSTDVREADPRLLGRLTIARGFPDSTPPADRDTRWYPLFVRHRAFSVQGTPTTTLVAVPAGQAVGGDDALQGSVVLFARAEAVSADAPPVKILVRGAREQAEMLLSYFENGVFKTVHQLGAGVIERAVSLLWDKREDPFGAAIAGYVLLRTAAHPEEQRNPREWMRNLAEWFPLIPDGAVIHGVSLLRSEDAEARPSRVEEARSSLLEAVARGIPTYTLGLRLLFDTLRALAEERKEDEELALALARVRTIAAYADWTTQTTTLTYPEGSPVARALEISD